MSLIKNREICIAVNNNANKWHRYTVDIIIAWFSKINKTKVIYGRNNDAINVSINEVFEQKIPATNVIIISGENMHEIDNEQGCNIYIGTNSTNQVYIPQLFLSLHEHRKSIDPDDYINLHTKFCAYLYFVSCEHRIKYYNLLSSYSQVTALGRCCGKDVVPTRYKYDEVETYNDIAISNYANGGFKFVIAMENSMGAGYSTEKLINPIIANCIPIYWGDAGIFKYINKKRVIYANDYTDEELLARVKELDTNNELYYNVLSESCFLIPTSQIYATYSKEICYTLSGL